MPKKKQVFEPENLESIRSAISGLIVCLLYTSPSPRDEQ